MKATIFRHVSNAHRFRRGDEVFIDSAGGIDSQRGKVLESVLVSGEPGYIVELLDGQTDLVHVDLVLPFDRQENPHGVLASSENDVKHVGQRVYYQPKEPSSAALLSDILGVPVRWEGFLSKAERNTRGLHRDGFIMVVDGKEMGLGRSVEQAILNSNAHIIARNKAALPGVIGQLLATSPEFLPENRSHRTQNPEPLDIIASRYGYKDAGELQDDINRIAALLPSDYRPQTASILSNYRVGASTTIYVPTRDGVEEYHARYMLVDAKALEASHLAHDDAGTFPINPRYPGGIQERRYHKDRQESDKVKNNARLFRPALVINTNPDAVNGPPIVDGEFVVLGGNSRTMTQQLVYAMGQGEVVKSYLRASCSAMCFGFSPVDVDELPQPILVRQVDFVARSDREKARHLVHIFNQVLTQELDFSAEIVAIANKISDGDWKDIAKFVGDNKNEEDTINTFLRKPVSVEFVRLLQQKNIITERNTSKYIETNRSKKNYGLFNRFGRRLVSELFLGRLIASPELLDLMGDGVINLVETIAPYIIVSSCCFSAWNLMEDFRVALGVLAQVKQPSKPEQRKEVLRSVLKQADMFGGGGYTEVQASERRKLLFHYLYAFVNAPKKLAAGFKDYAKRASQTYEEQFALPGLVPASGEQESFSQLLLSFGARVDSEPGSPSGFVIQGDPMGGELHQRAPNPLRKIQFQLPQGKGRKPLELGGTYDTETGMYTPAQQTPAAYRERLQGRIVETESDAKRAWRAMNLLTAMEGVTEHADWRQAATVLQESITHGQMSLDTFEFIKLLLFGVTEPVDETPLEVESQVPDALVDVVDTLPEEPVSNESPEDGLYTYDGRTFRIDRSLQPGNLVFYHSISGDKPIIISESEERQGNQIYSLGSGSMRPLTLWRVRGAEMTADGWREMQRTIEAEPAFDRVLRGAFTGFQSFAQIYPQLHPIEFLEMHQGRLQEQRAYEQAESREEVEREGLRKAEVGLWFEQEISRTIAEGGWIPDTVEASALRSWFKQNGLSVSLKVRRYSMASGLDFSLREPSSGSRETLRRMTDIRPDEIGILAHNRTGQGDILIKYPYVDSLATLLASRFKVYVDKKGEGHFTITPAGLRIAAGESISSMFRGKDPLQISGNESPEVLRYFAADLAMRALVSMEQLGLEAEPETKQAIQAIQQHAAHVSSDDLLATTALLRTISPGNSGERKVVGMLLLAAQSDIQSSIHEVVQMAGAYMLEHVGMGYDEDWMVDRLHFLLDLWNASGIRGLQLLFEGSHPMGSGPAYGQGIS